MTASEFAFLAVGLVLGVASGVAIAEVFRSRPQSPREVRVTVAPDSVPRRSSTLSMSAFLEARGPAPGGPADDRTVGRDAPREPPPAEADRPRQPLAPIGIAIRPQAQGGDVMRDALRAAEARAAAMLRGPGPGRPDQDSAAQAGTTTGARSVTALADRLTAIADRPAIGDPGVAQEHRPRSATERESSGVTSALRGAPVEAGNGPAQASSGPCADARRIADERCELASTARERATSAAATLRETQRAYDLHQERAERAAAAADPLRVRAAKDTAQRAFRSARDRAGTRAELEAAARNWLGEINRINAEGRGSAETAAAERAAALELVTALERLAVDADAARIGAETAEEACVAARQALADCEESAPEPPPAEPRAPSLEPSGRPDLARPIGSPRFDDGDADADDDADDGLAAAAASGEPRVLALLRGDRGALAAAAAEIAGDDEAARREWALQIGRLVESIVARAIEAASLDFPTEHPFWGPFTRTQNREITAALASLGFRFDGLGGWADDRIPSQRDLSLAVGYAGLDPMRIRRWPNETEMADLFRDVRVAADEYVVQAASGLTLGELVSLLERRADALTDVWNAWGRVRRVLLESSRPPAPDS